MPVRAHGISMMPTYEEGQFIFVNRLAYRFSPVKRGDVVAITLKGGEAVLVKRIIALPGETVRIDGGQVFIDGVPLDEPYLRYHMPWNMKDGTVAADEVFVIGDNRSMRAGEPRLRVRAPGPHPGPGHQLGLRPAPANRAGLRAWRRRRGPGGRLAVQLLLGAEDAAPVAVLIHRHAALHTHPHPLLGFGLAAEQLFQERHHASEGSPTAIRSLTR